ncbi:MAG: hypothetical protein HYW15_02305 [Candidatus Giovannonibacteria bacterium]|nr:MAG: hypothetical protein HYW15_02305 [Candidatus Giovannonibacteria bacterium]
MAFSILIKNGTVLDGSGGAPYLADVGISANRIVKIGNLSDEAAEQIIDATNLYVTPGFVDITNHSDVYGTLFSVPSQESLLRQGITTILLGNCGESLAPVVKRESLFGLERWTTGFSVPINWNSLPEYYENIERLGVGVNVATLVGHETLKRNANSKDERLFLLEKSLAEGAWGMSSNFSFADWNGDEEDELLGLLSAVKKQGGLYKVHIRDEGKNFLPSVSSVVSLARKSSVRTVISHFKAVGRGAWTDFGGALGIINAARNEGVEISFDVFPYLRTGSMLVSLLPTWAREGGSEDVLKKLGDPAIAAKILAELKSATLHPKRILVASALNDKSAVGKDLGELSEKTGIEPEALLVELLKINDLNVSIFGKTLNEPNLLAGAKYAGSIIASDGAGYDVAESRFGNLAHPRSFGAFPRFFNLISARAKIPLGNAVAKMTSLPARAAGFGDRGLLKPKYIADVAIFHPEEFKDRATYKNPYRYASGLRFLLISGKFAIEDGAVLPERYGVVLRKK